MPDFLPRRQADFLHWSASFGEALSAAPPGAYRITPQQLAEYLQFQAAFASAYARASAPSTASPTAMIEKQQAEAALRKNARVLAGMIRVTPGLTAAEKVDFGLSSGVRTARPAGPPTEAPFLWLDWPRGGLVKATVRDASRPTSRAKPAGVVAAMYFYFVGEKPPASLSAWRRLASATRTTRTLQFNSSIAPNPGTKVWITAMWVDRKCRRGPAAQPACTYLSFNGPSTSKAA